MELRELGLYVILDRTASKERPLDQILEAVLRGGCRWVQYREKEMPAREQLALGRRLRAQAAEAGAFFIMNDRLDLALAVEADGLHVGQEDLPAPVARRLLGSGLLGVSSHRPAESLQAQADGADYVAVGSIFPTPSKTQFQLVGLDLIRRVRPGIRVPLVAIGGITLENVASVIEAGADGVAVISAVCGADDPAATTAEFLKAIALAKVRRPQGEAV